MNEGWCAMDRLRGVLVEVDSSALVTVAAPAVGDLPVGLECRSTMAPVEFPAGPRGLTLIQQCIREAVMRGGPRSLEEARGAEIEFVHPAASMSVTLVVHESFRYCESLALNPLATHFYMPGGNGPVPPELHFYGPCIVFDRQEFLRFDSTLGGM